MTGSLVSAGTRERVRGMAAPIATALGRLGLTPNALTVIGFVGTCIAAWAASERAWTLAGVLVLAFGIFDLFDGALARATDRATPFGAFVDSTFDRAGEAIVYIGIAIGSLYGGSPQDTIVVAAAMASSFMVSYVRAKAESLGYSPGSGLMNVGLAPREVRLAILALGLIVAGQIGEAAGAMNGALGLITILATITVIQRVLHVRAQAKEG